MKNFGEPSKNKERRLGYNSIKTISFFPSNSYLCFEIYFKEIKFFSLVFVEHGDHFTFLNSLRTYLERSYFIEFNANSCAIPRVDDHDFKIANCVSYVLGVEDRRSMEKEIGPILEDLSISLSLNLLYVMKPFKEIFYLWNSYNIETLVDKLDALFAYPLLGMDSRTNLSKGVDSMTWDAQEIVELLQGPVTRGMARRMEEKHQGKITIFEKMIKTCLGK
ncbi:hypothetical protein M9H77_22036 [Catharanthus roseus]|uniref:Uncharacterized protein n=1 Tax=Catharanthus roseus TaxID=4058 RepID=A0ACC0AP15_CATRO|nr:hypothetical protein M9H77_22036 [Catharanthus roseus]